MSTATDSAATDETQRPRQGLIIRPDGLVEVSFLSMLTGSPIDGEFRGTSWRAFLEQCSALDNGPATAFARSLGWRGEGTLRGVAVFVGDALNPDVPGSLLAAAMRMWDVELN
ncbi:hypothetical protein [Nocardioides jiangxiensis]|uniref:Barstar (barnase inhibitor) domain-containing protein n=1 Tax=Nocardioides jiangxiensis TaxID=3064524 RepID=A0ABT9AX70_9ACTN|nr:hypothetical protein [Nocardioides sp. WY-20]MDO7867117.1 hypothetical protein [Nocardioides sp. WY-20]